MKKYYIGFAILMAVVLGSFVYAIMQASDSKSDHTTNKAIEDISNKLDSYVSSNGVPDNLTAADIKNVPDTVKYSKISSKQYKLCVSYKTATSGFDAGWSGLLLGGLYGGDYTDYSGSGGADNSYFNSTVETNHKKGPNCQTVTPYTYNDYSGSNSFNFTSPPPSSDNSSSPGSSEFSSDCKTPASQDPVHGQATIKSIVNGDPGTITFDTNGQTISNTATGASAPTPIASKKFDSLTAVCDAGGKPTSLTAIKAGQKVSFYIYSTDSEYVDLIQQL